MLSVERQGPALFTPHVCCLIFAHFAESSKSKVVSIRDWIMILCLHKMALRGCTLIFLIGTLAGYLQAEIRSEGLRFRFVIAQRSTAQRSVFRVAFPCQFALPKHFYVYLSNSPKRRYPENPT